MTASSATVQLRLSLLNMLVVADTTPLNYLILIGQAELPPRLYKSIIVPEPYLPLPSTFNHALFALLSPLFQDHLVLESNPGLRIILGLQNAEERARKGPVQLTGGPRIGKVRG